MNRLSFTVEEDVQRRRDEVFLLRLRHVVLVEGKTDKWFWSRVLDQVIPQQYKIYADVNSPAPQASGKLALASFLPFAAPDFIICLDSDFDYLLQAPGIQQPFVLHTYVYSVENMLCYAPTLTKIVSTKIGRQETGFDFEGFFVQYSETVYAWLLVQVHARQQQQPASPYFPALEREQLARPFEHLNAMRVQIEQEICQDLSRLHPAPAFQSLAVQLAQLGLTPQNAYLFIRGHELLNKVTLPLLKAVADPLVKLEFEKRGNEDKAAYQAYHKQYPFEKLLAENPQVEDCPFFPNIVEDLRSFFSAVGSTAG